MTALRVLVVGQGGREHALAWRLASDLEVAEVLVAPGNDGMARSFRRFAAAETDGEALAALCAAERVDLAVIGPDAALAAGVADRLSQTTLVFGPTQAAARLEWSKWFAKEVMAEAGVPTARAQRFDRLDRARLGLAHSGPPWVIKADGLAAGKGVLVTSKRAEAETFLESCLHGSRFGDSGRTVVVEEFLEGEELSVTAICDGASYVLLPAARDYKRALDGDQGPMTGGMGTYAPAADRALAADAAQCIVTPLLETMARRGTPFRGAMYAGLMLTPQGPKVLEINARFGDPETQVMLPLVEGSLARLLHSAARGELDARAISLGSDHMVAVALVDQGYPDAVRGGGTLGGLDRLPERPGILVFHAGTQWEEGAWRVRGGRAAYVAARAFSREAARERVYAAVGELDGEGWRYRRDIAADGSMAAISRPAS